MKDEDEIKQPFIVWLNYHTEGWRPRGFSTEADAIDFILGDAGGDSRILTRALTLRAEEPK